MRVSSWPPAWRRPPWRSVWRSRGAEATSPRARRHAIVDVDFRRVVVRDASTDIERRCGTAFRLQAIC